MRNSLSILPALAPRRILRRTSGFTLIELSIALLLLTLMFSIAIPRFSELTEVNLRSSARQLAAMMRFLYAEAGFKKTYFSLIFDLSTQSYWVEAPRLNPETKEIQMVEISDQSLILRRKLPAGIRFREIKIGSQEALHDGKAEMHFFPGGYADPASIHIQDRKEREFTLFLIPLSGRVLVQAGNLEFPGT
ncbi:MAG: prepilin-type N-terminal cleavage/methylation domain-containing protein [bacterium]|nr:prepilin-type N-terminal cleavage/methylation domain-containing protein [bacterium]